MFNSLFMMIIRVKSQAFLLITLQAGEGHQARLLLDKVYQAHLRKNT
jgi:hypothetical protein